jgi:hypothetical protein
MFIQPVNDFHPFHAFLDEELDSVPLLHFHEKQHSFGIAPVIVAGNGLDGTKQFCDCPLFID